MASEAPKVGIAMAVYRPELTDFVSQLSSIRDQTYRNWFCVITADSPLQELRDDELLKPFFSDSRFIWKENAQRRGFKKNFEEAIREACGLGAQYIACSDQDDIWYPEKLATCVSRISSLPALSIVHSDMDLLVQGKKLEQSAWQVERRAIDNVSSSAFFVRNVVTGASMVMDANLAKRFQTIPDEIEFHDWWFGLAASFYGGVYPVRERLYSYRQHGDNVVGVVAYEGLIGISTWKAWLALHKKTMFAWRKSFSLARRAKETGFPLTFENKVIFLWPYDLGFGLVLLGLPALCYDRPFARACFIRAIGKFLSVLSGYR